MIDLTGMRFGKWTVVSRSYDKAKSKGSKWNCKCECSAEKIVWGKHLRTGKSRSCGCDHFRKWIGERFGKLIVQSVCREDGENIYQCLCDCGNEIEVRGTSIYGTESCGCSRRHNHAGERYGKLVIQDVIYNMNGDNVTYAACKCDCGVENYITRLSGLRTGNTKSCGCTHNPNLQNMKFGRLTVIEQVKSNTPKRMWKCRCDCGREIELESYKFTSGHTKSCGCLRTEKNSSAEMLVKKILNNNDVYYLPEHTFDDCIGVNGWKLRFDFYLPDYKLAIECDGEQHFHPVAFYGGVEKFETLQANDKIKNEYCENKSILLLRLPYTEKDEDYSNIILNYIKQEPRNDHSLKGND